MGNAALYVVLLAVLLRLAFAAFTGLGIDESYMVAASHQFAASYFDHPLASWWLELASRWLFGSASPLVVRLPFVAISAISSWLLYLLTRRLYGNAAAFWAVVAYTISPVFSLAFGAWVLPDGPLDAALLAAAYALSQATGVAVGAQSTKARPGWWLAAGLFAGLALLSKYNAGLVLAGALLFVLTDPPSRLQLRRWHPWAGGLLAVAMFSPVIWWNMRHGWQSFHYQSGRAEGLRLHPLAFFTIFGGEALFVLPWLWLPMAALLLAALRRGPAHRADWMLATLAVIAVTLFSVVGVWSATRILYHWATPGYLLLLPMLGNWAAGWRRQTVRNTVAGISAALLASAMLLIIGVSQFNILPGFNEMFPPGKSPMLQLVNWDSLRPQIQADNVQAVAALRWYDAGKVGYALRGSLPVTVFGPEPHQFGITTPPASLLGKTVMILAMPGSASLIARQYAPYFRQFSPAPPLSVTFHGDLLLVIPIFIGTDMQAVPPP